VVGTLKSDLYVRVHQGQIPPGPAPPPLPNPGSHACLHPSMLLNLLDLRHVERLPARAREGYTLDDSGLLVALVGSYEDGQDVDLLELDEPARRRGVRACN